MDEIIKAEPLTLALAALALLAYAVVKLIGRWRGGNGESHGNGLERRVSMKELREDIADLRVEVSTARTEVGAVRSLADTNAQSIKALSDGQAGLHRRFDALEERERKGDTQTARELGALTAHVETLGQLVTAARREAQLRNRDSKPEVKR